MRMGEQGLRFVHKREMPSAKTFLYDRRPRVQIAIHKNSLRKTFGVVHYISNGNKTRRYTKPSSITARVSK